MKNIAHKILVLFTVFMIACGIPHPEFSNFNHWREVYPADDGSRAEFKVASTGSEILLRLTLPSNVDLYSLNQSIRSGRTTVSGAIGFRNCSLQYTLYDSRESDIYYQNGSFFLKVKFNARISDGSIWYVRDTTGESYACMTQRTLHFEYGVVFSGAVQTGTDIGESSIWFSGEQRM